MQRPRIQLHDFSLLSAPQHLPPHRHDSLLLAPHDLPRLPEAELRATGRLDDSQIRAESRGEVDRLEVLSWREVEAESLLARGTALACSVGKAGESFGFRGRGLVLARNRVGLLGGRKVSPCRDARRGRDSRWSARRGSWWR